MIIYNMTIGNCQDKRIDPLSFFDMLIKLANALEIEMWEMFDFGHTVSRKELKEAVQNFARTADESTLRLALKVIKAVVR